MNNDRVCQHYENPFSVISTTNGSSPPVVRLSMLRPLMFGVVVGFALSVAESFDNRFQHRYIVSNMDILDIP